MTDSVSPAVRRRAVYEGRVQGVGFRFTAAEIARSFAVSGYVRNCADGTVELEAQGKIGEVERFLAEIERVMRSNIRARHATERAVREGEAGFEVRY